MSFTYVNKCSILIYFNLRAYLYSFAKTIDCGAYYKD